MALASSDLDALSMGRKHNNGSVESFGQRLARIRKARNYSQRDLAAELEISQRMLAYYEAQTRRPPAHLLPKLCEVLRLSADELLGIRDAKLKDGTGHPRLWRKLRQIEKLPPGERRALLKTIDAYLVKASTAGSGRG